jgi:hypothetical protein
MGKLTGRMLRAIASRSPEAAISYSFSASICFSDFSNLFPDNRKEVVDAATGILTLFSFEQCRSKYSRA